VRNSDLFPLYLVFAWELLGFVALAFLESAVEGPNGGGAATFGWKKSLLGYEVREYHFWLWYVVVPIFVFSPIVVTGPDLIVFATLASAYLLGGPLEDFAYFVVNRNFGVRKWNSRVGTWMPWYKAGRVEIPRFYVRNFLVVVLVWVVVYLLGGHETPPTL